jgi:hypothetical protein
MSDKACPIRNTNINKFVVEDIIKTSKQLQEEVDSPQRREVWRV